MTTAPDMLVREDPAPMHTRTAVIIAIAFTALISMNVYLAHQNYLLRVAVKETMKTLMNAEDRAMETALTCRP